MHVCRRAVVAALMLLSVSAADAETDGSSGIQWGPLLEQSAYFLSIQHGFRLATEAGTRQGFQGNYLKNYAKSIGSLHGWSDGDPAIVNYVGHPMQGSVAGFIFAQNDNKYRQVEFGSSRAYWKSRMRATAYSWAYSTQFEIGLFSEASIGSVQSKWPQFGLVDHVVTPAIGLGWQVAEDALDRYLIKRFENRFENRWARMMVRGWLNPARSMANLMRGETPWHRDNRAGILSYRPGMEYTMKEDPPAPDDALPLIELAPRAQVSVLRGGQCIGGGAQAGYRLNPHWYALLDISGCKMLDMPYQTSADSLQYMAGLQWKARPGQKWNPHLQFLIGGNKTTREVIDAEKRREIEKEWQGRSEPLPYDRFATRAEANGLAFAAGGGIDYRLTRAFSLRVAGLEYTKTFARELDGVRFNEGLRASMGFVLHVGNW